MASGKPGAVQHSDLMLGTIACNAATIDQVRAMAGSFGMTVGADDAYLAARGIRTLVARLKSHEANALEVAAFLESHEAVAQVVHPALPSHPDHALWARDFSGASGLFGFTLARPSATPVGRHALEAFVNGMELFGIGSSWGGYESLLIPTNPLALRTAAPRPTVGQQMRIHVGLEDPAMLIADLAAGLSRWSDALER